MSFNEFKLLVSPLITPTVVPLYTGLGTIAHVGLHHCADLNPKLHSLIEDHIRMKRPATAW